MPSDSFLPGRISAHFLDDLELARSRQATNGRRSKRGSAARRLHNDGNPGEPLVGTDDADVARATHRIGKAGSDAIERMEAELAAASLSQDAAVDRLQKELT